MKIEDDIKVHSHAIGELYAEQSLLRKRSHEMNEKILIHSHIIKNDSENIMEAINNQKSFQQTLFDIKTQLEIFKKEDSKRRSNIEFFKELFDKKRNWIIVFGFIFLIESMKGLEISKVVGTLVSHVGAFL